MKNYSKLDTRMLQRNIAKKKVRDMGEKYREKNSTAKADCEGLR